jgi:hypothetical protein
MEPTPKSKRDPLVDYTLEFDLSQTPPSSFPTYFTSEVVYMKVRPRWIPFFLWWLTT